MVMVILLYSKADSLAGTDGTRQIWTVIIQLSASTVQERRSFIGLFALQVRCNAAYNITINKNKNK